MFSPDFVRDPYPTYRELLRGPVLQLIDPARRVWAAFRYAQLQALFRDSRLSSLRPANVLVRTSEQELPQFIPLIEHMQRWLLLKDPPSHTALRKSLNKGFSPTAIERLRPLIERQVRLILDGLSSIEEIDIIRDVAYPLPVRVISTLLGVPDAALDRCVELSNVISVWFASMVRLPETARPAQAAVLELTQIFGSIVAQRRKEGPREDLLDLLLQIGASETMLADEELLAQCVMLLFGGHETTRHWIGNSIHTFLEQPQVMLELRKDPSLVRVAMEEVLRYHSPVQMFGRTPLAEIEVEGARVAPGDSLLLVVAAANRDPAQFEEPDAFDFRRSHNRHMAFGGDSHVCLGSTLARLEGVITVTQLLRRFPSLRLAEEAPRWSSMIGFRGLDTLRVRI
jgi:cytochrome P450